MPELKPCPFCGNKVEIAYSIENWPYGIWCHRCHMIVKWSDIKDGKKFTSGMIYEQLAERWNRREDGKP